MPYNKKVTRQKQSGFFCRLQPAGVRAAPGTAPGGDGAVRGRRTAADQQTNVRYATGFYEVGWIVPAYFYMAFIPGKGRPSSSRFLSRGMPDSG